MASCKILAKSFMHSKKALNRLYQSKANLVGMHTQLQQQLALVSSRRASITGKPLTQEDDSQWACHCIRVQRSVAASRHRASSSRPRRTVRSGDRSSGRGCVAPAGSGDGAPGEVG